MYCWEWAESERVRYYIILIIEKGWKDGDFHLENFKGERVVKEASWCFWIVMGRRMTKSFQDSSRNRAGPRGCRHNLTLSWREFSVSAGAHSYCREPKWLERNFFHYLASWTEKTCLYDEITTSRNFDLIIIETIMCFMISLEPWHVCVLYLHYLVCIFLVQLYLLDYTHLI